MRKRSKEIKVRMTDDEYLKYSALLDKSGLCGNEYGLKKLLNEDIFVLSEAGEILLLLKNIGNNLNQLTRLANAGMPLPLDVVTELKEQVEELWRLLKRCGKVKA